MHAFIRQEELYCFSILLPLTKLTLMGHVLLEIQKGTGSLASTHPHKHILSCINKQHCVCALPGKADHVSQSCSAAADLNETRSVGFLVPASKNKECSEPKTSPHYSCMTILFSVVSYFCFQIQTLQKKSKLFKLTQMPVDLPV